MTQLPRIAIDLEGDCTGSDGCRALARSTYDRLHVRYRSPCALQKMPGSIEDWLAAHRTARKRAAACERTGYTTALIDRCEWEDDIYGVNISAPERQGKPMGEGYLEPPSFSPLPEQPCPRHRIQAYGVFDTHRLVGYLVLYRVGALVMVSQILGHADELDAGIMYLLFRDALAHQIRSAGPGFAFYNMHDSGTEGLRFFKARLGFDAYAIEWRERRGHA